MALAGFKNYGSSGRMVDGYIGLENRHDSSHLQAAAPQDEQPGFLGNIGETVKNFFSGDKGILINRPRGIGMLAGFNPVTQFVTIGTDNWADRNDLDVDVKAATEEKNLALGNWVRNRLKDLDLEIPAGQPVTTADFCVALQGSGHENIKKVFDEAGTTPGRTAAGLVAGCAPAFLFPGLGWIAGGVATLIGGMSADVVYTSATQTDDGKPGDALEILTRLAANRRVPLDVSLARLDAFLGDGGELADFQLPAPAQNRPAPYKQLPVYSGDVASAYDHPSGLPYGLNGNMPNRAADLSLSMNV